MLEACLAPGPLLNALLAASLQARIAGRWVGATGQVEVLTSDAHEWINEIPTVPTYYLAKPQPRERAWHN